MRKEKKRNLLEVVITLAVAITFVTSGMVIIITPTNTFLDNSMNNEVKMETLGFQDCVGMLANGENRYFFPDNMMGYPGDDVNIRVMLETSYTMMGYGFNGRFNGDVFEFIEESWAGTASESGYIPTRTFSSSPELESFGGLVVCFSGCVPGIVPGVHVVVNIRMHIKEDAEPGTYIFEMPYPGYPCDFFSCDGFRNPASTQNGIFTVLDPSDPDRNAGLTNLKVESNLTNDFKNVDITNSNSNFKEGLESLYLVEKEKIPNESVLKFDFSFPEPEIVNQDDGKYISMEGLNNYGDPGKPIMPNKAVRILIPQDKDVESIEVIPGNYILLSDSYTIAPGQQPIYYNFKGEKTRSDPDPIIYNSNRLYPSEFYEFVSIQHFRGYKILILNLCPIKYLPTLGEIYYYPNIELQINLCPGAPRPNVLPCRNLPKDWIRIKEIVENPDMIFKYKSDCNKILNSINNIFVDPADSYEYVVITNEALKESNSEYTFQDLTQSKIDKGLTATIVTVEEIINEPAYWNDNPIYNDTQAKIRNFIKDAYQNWETEYILLGGDGDGEDVGGESGDAIIPVRYLDSFIETELEGSDIAADLYYACLDGTWNEDGDEYWGEDGEDDLYAEVYVGRAPVDSEEELSNFIMKTLVYDNSEDPYLERVWMVGEYIGGGGDLEYAANSKDEIRNGSDNHGYETAGIPDEYIVQTLYDRDGPEWTKLSFNISDYVGHEGVRLRFGITSVPPDEAAGMYIDDVEIIADGEQIFFDDMENGENGWIHLGDSDDWELGMPIYGPESAYSGLNVWGTKLSEEYSPHSRTLGEQLITPSIDLMNRENVIFSFHIWYDIANDNACEWRDYGWLDISMEGGESGDDDCYEWPCLEYFRGDIGWSKESIISVINNGVHIINHLGHGNNYHLMKLDHPVYMRGSGCCDDGCELPRPCHDLDSLSNTDYFFGYSQACFPGAFDNLNTYDSSEYLPWDSIVEHLLVSPHGAFAFIANSRSGVGIMFTTNGPSQRYDREFFDEIFGENNRILGKAHHYAKEDCICSINGVYMRYIYYGLNLLGDPELSIKDPPRPEHDIQVLPLEIDESPTVDMNININAPIYNYGLNSETNVYVELLIDDIVIDDITISFIGSGETYLASFNWETEIEGYYNIEVKAEPVPGDSHVDNNVQIERIYIYPRPPIKVFILDSWGTDWFGLTSWNELTVNWMDYGDIPVVVDYSKLNHDGFNYQDLVDSEADILFISFAWNQNFPIVGEYEFTDSEIDAITQYVLEDHGLIATGDSFNGNNQKLLPLFGIKENIEFNDQWIYTKKLDLLYEDHPIFRSITNPYVLERMVWTSYPNDNSWDNDDLVGGAYIAKSSKSRSAIIANNKAVYFSSYLEYDEYGFSPENLKLLYNAMLSVDNPTAFFASANGPYKNLVDIAIQFSGSVYGGKSPYSYHWDFGDGDTSEEQNPNHIYDEVDNFVVTLTVTDDDGNTSKDTTTATIKEKLFVNANGPYTGTVDESIQFIGSATGGFSPYSWYWNFGDGKTSEEQSPTHIYTESDNYTVSLIVTDNEGFICSNYSTVEVTKQDDQISPLITILKPERGLYINNNKILRLPLYLIVGDINIEVETSDDQSGINRVEFFVNGIFKANDTNQPYSWRWDERTLLRHRHTIQIISFDNEENQANESLIVWKFF